MEEEEVLVSRYLLLIRTVEEINEELRTSGKYSNEQLAEISIKYALELPNAIFTEEELDTIRESTLLDEIENKIRKNKKSLM